ncbi:MAG: type II secretion system F family protein, partial [Desulfobacteraceae bacterium]|nr:type II secretion system F family protein [Desulfobacteraceae bacterium]
IAALAIFIVAVLIIELIFYAIRSARNPDRERIRRELKKIASSRQIIEGADILRRRVLSEIPALNEILLRITGIQRLDKLRYQANTRYPSGFFILLSFVLVGVVFLICNFLITIGFLLSAVLAVFSGSFPFLYLYIKKKKRINKFQTQLPEALDMMARSLKAGHAFSTGMKLAGDEFEDPLGPEFSITIDEINFGLGVPDALKNLVNRLDCKDLNFFVVAVILQRETGGNLAEIMESIAFLIRERFKFYGKVKALCAEGKMSMMVLVLLPFFIIGALLVVNPKYIMTLFTDPMGKIMCAGALVMMAIGGFVMNRIVQIEV